MKSELKALLDDIANTRDYENLIEILGDDLGGKLYRLVDMARNADRDLFKIRHELVGDEVFIREIEESESISGEKKLHALCEIDLMRRGEASNACYDRRVSNLVGAFIWNNAPSGYKFWSTIDQTV
jgi:hypothetical protein